MTEGNEENRLDTYDMSQSLLDKQKEVAPQADTCPDDGMVWYSQHHHVTDGITPGQIRPVLIA